MIKANPFTNAESEFILFSNIAIYTSIKTNRCDFFLFRQDADANVGVVGRGAGARTHPGSR